MVGNIQQVVGRGGCHQSRLKLSTMHVQVASAEITFKCPLSVTLLTWERGAIPLTLHQL